MALITDLILTPIVFGLIGMVIKRISRWLALISSAISTYYSIQLLGLLPGSFTIRLTPPVPIIFQLDLLSVTLSIATSVLTFLVVLYAINQKIRDRFFVYIPIALGISLGALLSSDLILFLFFWGFLLAIVFGLLLVGKEGRDPSAAAQKALFLLGASDFAMLLGIVLLLTTIGIGSLTPPFPKPLTSPIAIAGFILILAGGVGKIGGFPFHTWIPKSADVVPPATMAFLPSVLDKILGTYLLIRLLTRIFIPSPSIALLIMIIGSITIVIGVFMALIQPNGMRTLAYSTIGQAGYIIVGLGTLHPIGIAGALFHMFNNIIYKTGLFFTLGSVEAATGRSNLEDLGGLAKVMPITFFSFLISGLALAGVPPLSGFCSKWMIYQAIIQSRSHWLWPAFLIAAMFGSVLTLAYILKLLYATFLSEPPKDLDLDRIQEATVNGWFPPLLLAVGAIVFGVFAYSVPIARIIQPILPTRIEALGFWQPVLATILLLIGLLIGLLIYLFGTALRAKESKIFIGGEEIDSEEGRIPGTHFYSSLPQIYMLEKIYTFGKGGAFDFYNYLVGIFTSLGIVAGKVIEFLIQKFYEVIAAIYRIAGGVGSEAHSGILPNYLSWLLLGLFFLFLFLW
ncbi:hypothetical protein DRP53_00210 [candidate division WOR-3 bacterium]|uniref:NADH:quinone oxidoreductase/Mrp antiporter transmembrane domain-containing protein n=1 Tax=candidate division WOR-3 bacterium TaxID=2052148 RepID=A0A660SPF2_UNCW3|nr:MAG: hypothetical protein DRP53_00210 [candidate division WOR-3 bacterium]